MPLPLRYIFFIKEISMTFLFTKILHLPLASFKLLIGRRHFLLTFLQDFLTIFYLLPPIVQLLVEYFLTFYWIFSFLADNASYESLKVHVNAISQDTYETYSTRVIWYPISTTQLVSTSSTKKCSLKGVTIEGIIFGTSSIIGITCRSLTKKGMSLFYILGDNGTHWSIISSPSSSLQ